MNCSLRTIVGATVFLFGTAACNQSGEGEEKASTADPDVTYPIAEMSKVFLSEATLQQVAAYSWSCHGNKICVEVCHRPPGNPANCKSKVLPLQATRAHLNHGGSHQDKDYLGPCVSGDSGGGGTDGGTNPDPGTDPGTEPGTDVGTGEPPFWCLPYIEIDSDCDGIIDATGDPLL